MSNKTNPGVQRAVEISAQIQSLVKELKTALMEKPIPVEAKPKTTVKKNKKT